MTENKTRLKASIYVSKCDCALPRKGKALYINLGTMERIRTGYTLVTVTRITKDLFRFDYSHPSPSA